MVYFIKKLIPALIIFLGISASPLATPFLAESLVAAGKDQTPILKVSRELLVFDIYWLGIYVGSASLEATNNKGSLTIVSKANSAPVISAIYRVEDYARSDVVNGKPVSFKIKQHEGRYRSNKETIFDSKNNKITFYNHIKGEKTEHNSAYKTSWDVISGFYYLRTFSLEPGRTVYINIFDSNKFYNAEVKVIGKEKISIFNNQEVNTIVIKPVLQSEGLFRKKGDILIWLTDDEYRIPVKLETSISIGKVVAIIKTIKTEK
jgi:hypothetical protein